MSRSRKVINVKYSKLKNLYGISYGDGVVHVDERLRGKKQFEIIIHEMLHEMCPEWTEEVVEKKAGTLTRSLWKEGYRKVDLHSKEKMQDELSEFKTKEDFR